MLMEAPPATARQTGVRMMAESACAMRSGCKTRMEAGCWQSGIASCCVWIWHAGVVQQRSGRVTLVAASRRQTGPQPLLNLDPFHPTTTPHLADLLLLPRPRRRYLGHHSQQAELKVPRSNALEYNGPHQNITRSSCHTTEL